MRISMKLNWGRENVDNPCEYRTSKNSGTWNVSLRTKSDVWKTNGGFPNCNQVHRLLYSLKWARVEGFHVKSAKVADLNINWLGLYGLEILTKNFDHLSCIRISVGTHRKPHIFGCNLQLIVSIHCYCMMHIHIYGSIIITPNNMYQFR